MAKARKSYEIELDAFLLPEGINCVLWEGDNDEPTIEFVAEWVELIKGVFEPHQVVGRDKWLSKFDNLPYQVDSVAEIGYIISALRDTANLIEHELHQHKIFDRERWVEETNMDPTRAHEFTEDLV